MADQTELTDVLESLVNDNETLKRDNAELQHLLTESREEIHALQEEVEEQRAVLPSRGGGKYPIVLPLSLAYLTICLAGTPLLRPNAFVNSVPSSLLKEHTVRLNGSRIIYTLTFF